MCLGVSGCLGFSSFECPDALGCLGEALRGWCITYISAHMCSSGQSVGLYDLLTVTSSVRVAGSFSSPVWVYPRVCVGPGVLKCPSGHCVSICVFLGVSVCLRGTVYPQSLCIHLSDSLLVCLSLSLVCVQVYGRVWLRLPHVDLGRADGLMSLSDCLRVYPRAWMSFLRVSGCISSFVCLAASR